MPGVCSARRRTAGRARVPGVTDARRRPHRSDAPAPRSRAAADRAVRPRRRRAARAARRRRAVARARGRHEPAPRGARGPRCRGSRSASRRAGRRPRWSPSTSSASSAGRARRGARGGGTIGGWRGRSRCSRIRGRGASVAIRSWPASPRAALPGLRGGRPQRTHLSRSRSRDAAGPRHDGGVHRGWNPPPSKPCRPLRAHRSRGGRAPRRSTSCVTRRWTCSA